MGAIKISVLLALIVAAICQLITLAIVLNVTNLSLGICGFISFLVGFVGFELIKMLRDKQKIA